MRFASERTASQSYSGRVDCVVLGAGVIGLAVARSLALAGREVLVLEAENVIGSGTSSRNSEVIHAGLYYPAGSLKARLCREGRDRLYDYCVARGVPYRRCGKLIVASGEDVGKLDAIAVAAALNGVDDLRRVEHDELAGLEPAIRGDAALLSPSTGIIDSHGLMLALQTDLENASGLIVCRSPVVGGSVEPGGIRLLVGGPDQTELHAAVVINSAGLAAPQVARSIHQMPLECVPQQHLAIGHYYTLSGPSPSDRLVYPVPTDGGLGVHLTLDLAGQARFGPDVRWIEEVNYRFDGSRFDEFIAAIRSYWPGLDPARLTEGYTGIRPKLAGPGAPAADFRIDGPDVHGIPGLVNLFGIESPGLTSCLAIADHVRGLLLT